MARGPASDGRHSPFALALFDALEKGDADLVPKGQGDGVITATELYLYLREQVEVQAEAQASHEQTPGLWPLNKHRKGEFIFLAPGHPLNLPPAPDLTDEANPYRGLKSYDQKHSPLFFGREDEIKELAALVDAAALRGRAGRVGHGQVEFGEGRGACRGWQRSGVRGQGTGVMRQGRRNQDRSWTLPRPAAHAAYRPAGAGVGGAAARRIRRRPARSQRPAGLTTPWPQIVARWAEAHPGQRLVLTIDQFEELATLCRDDAERERFLRLLAAAVQRAARRLPPDHHPAHRLRAAVHPGRTRRWPDAWQAGPLRRAAHGHRGPAPGDRRAGLGARALLRPAGAGGRPDQGGDPDPRRAAAALLHPERAVRQVRAAAAATTGRCPGADYKALGGVVGSLRNRATEEYDQPAGRRAPGDHAARHAAHGGGRRAASWPGGGWR